MKKMKTLVVVALLALMVTGCANNGYKKKPVPCDGFMAALAGDNPCGPKRPINW